MIDLFEQPKREKSLPKKATPTAEPKKKSTKADDVSNSESPKKKQRKAGTILYWRNGAGQIMSDTGRVLEVHQVDLQFHGKGPRDLPVNHQCEFEFCKGPMGEPRACEVSRSAGRAWVFQKKEVPESKKVVNIKIGNSQKLKTTSVKEDPEAEQLMKYLCISETDKTINKGTILYFNADLHYACIQMDNHPEKEIFCDASGLVKDGSFMSVRRGVKVEFIKGVNAAGLEVATKCTGSDKRPIDNRSKRTAIIKKRKLKKNTKTDQRKRQKVVEPDIVLPPKPKILSGKNPVSMVIEFAVCCKPKKIVTFKLVDEQFRARCKNGVKTAFTFECRLDDEPVSKGTATTKRVAKSYAAFYAIETLSKQSEANKLEFERIRACIPQAKKKIMPQIRPRRFNFRVKKRSASYSRVKRTVQDTPTLQYAQVITTPVAVPYSSYQSNNVANKISYATTENSYPVSQVAYYGTVSSYNVVSSYNPSPPATPGSSYSAPSFSSRQSSTASQYQSSTAPTHQAGTVKPSAYASNIYKPMSVSYGDSSTAPSTSVQRMLNSQSGSQLQGQLQFRQPVLQQHAVVQSEYQPEQAGQATVKVEPGLAYAVHRTKHKEPGEMQRQQVVVKQEYQSVQPEPVQVEQLLTQTEQPPVHNLPSWEAQRILQRQRTTSPNKVLQETESNWEHSQNQGTINPWTPQATEYEQPKTSAGTYQSNHQPTSQKQGVLQHQIQRLENHGAVYSPNVSRPTWAQQPQPEVQSPLPSSAPPSEQLQNQQQLNYNYYNNQQNYTTTPADHASFHSDAQMRNRERNPNELHQQAQQPDQTTVQVPTTYPYQQPAQTQQSGLNSSSYPYQQQPPQMHQKGANNISQEGAYMRSQDPSAQAQQYSFYN